MTQAFNKLKHIDHLEDCIITSPLDFSHATGLIEKIINNSNDTITTIKTDGSPGFVLGAIPKNEPNGGQLFVGLKSALGKTAKRYTLSNIKDLYVDYDNQLATKLKNIYMYGLLVLPTPIDKIYQGDFLFDKESNVFNKETIDDIEYYTFTPNVITYGVEKNSNIGRAISKSKLGIVIHTEYCGNTFDTLQVNYDIDYNQFKDSHLCWLTNFKIKIVDLPNEVIHKVKLQHASALAYITKCLSIFSELENNKQLKTLLIRFINKHIRENKKINYNDINTIKHFIEFIVAYNTKEQTKFKTEKKRAQVVDEGVKLLDFIVKHTSELHSLFMAHKLLTDCKTTILENVSILSPIKQFYKEGIGYIETLGEGLVVVDKSNNSIVKLVDRYQFSYRNFQKDL